MSHSSEAPNALINSLIPELDLLAADVMADWKVPGAALAVSPCQHDPAVVHHGKRRTRHAPVGHDLGGEMIEFGDK